MRIAPKSIKSSEIYWGALPWVAMQMILVIIVIFWPGSVTYWISGPAIEDPAAIERKLQNLQIPGADSPAGLPAFELDPPSIK